MEKLAEKFKEKRPNLSHTSIKTYLSILSNLYKRMDGKGDMYDFFKDNLDKVIDHLKDDRPNLRKTKLAVLVSLFGDDADTAKLREIMLEDANEYNATLRNQQMNDRQKQNWLTTEEIREVYKKTYKKAVPLMKATKKPNKKEYQDILDFVLLSLYTLIPPRRSQDFSEMKLRNYDKDTDNYYDGKVFVFHKYKTSKNYGTQTIRPTQRLRNILKKWAEINPHDYLLASYDGNKASVSRITLMLNKIFGKNVSTTMLRHIYITESVLKDAPTLKQREDVAMAMGHDTDTQELYRKV
jgi:preprotein translocase subunit Sss1